MTWKIPLDRIDTSHCMTTPVVRAIKAGLDYVEVEEPDWPTCAGCHKPLIAFRKGAQYHGEACRKKAARRAGRRSNVRVTARA